MELIPFRDFGHYPPAMWAVLAVFFVLFIDAARNFAKPWAKPALAVYVTIFLWYPGNFIYVGTAWFYHYFPAEVVNRAFWQIISFIVVFRLTLPTLFRLMRPKTLPKGYVSLPLSTQMQPLLIAVFILWLLLFVIGWIRMEDPNDIIAILWPLSSKNKLDLYVHSGIGGRFGFLEAMAQYLYQLCAVFFGVAAVLSRGWFRVFAIVMVLISYPYFMFARVRNVQLSLIAPAVMAFLFLSKSRPSVKVLVGIGAFFMVHLWFLAVGHYRSDFALNRFTNYFSTNRTNAFTGFHYGLEMMEELCHMNNFIDKGRINVKYGMDYAAESLNFVPRAIWPNKPRLGYEYLMERGFTDTQVTGQQFTVFATIATGMIGQGVYNFGIYFGPPLAAALVSLWAAYLSKLWVERWRLGKAFLMLLGLGLTFNLGRGISLLVLWPFVFGVACLYIWSKVFEIQPLKYHRTLKR